MRLVKEEKIQLSPCSSDLVPHLSTTHICISMRIFKSATGRADSAKLVYHWLTMTNNHTCTGHLILHDPSCSPHTVSIVPSDTQSKLATCMALHERLGDGAHMNALPSSVLELVWAHVAQNPCTDDTDDEEWLGGGNCECLYMPSTRAPTEPPVLLVASRHGVTEYPGPGLEGRRVLEFSFEWSTGYRCVDVPDLCLSVHRLV